MGTPKFELYKRSEVLGKYWHMHQLFWMVLEAVGRIQSLYGSTGAGVEEHKRLFYCFRAMKIVTENVMSGIVQSCAIVNTNSFVESKIGFKNGLVFSKAVRMHSLVLVRSKVTNFSVSLRRLWLFRGRVKGLKVFMFVSLSPLFTRDETATLMKLCRHRWSFVFAKEKDRDLEIRTKNCCCPHWGFFCATSTCPAW